MRAMLSLSYMLLAVSALPKALCILTVTPTGVLCPETSVVFNCTIIAESLFWTVSPDSSSTSSASARFANDDQGDKSINVNGIVYTATLLTLNPTITSTLTVTATNSVDGHIVRCVGDNGVVIGNVTIDVSQSNGAPLSPQNLRHVIVHEGKDNVTITLMWDHPMSIDIINYTLTLSSSMGSMSQVVTSLSSNVTLLYNVNYTVQVAANNCAGRSDNSLQGSLRFASPFDCGQPGTPVNGTLGSVSATTEGSMVFYQCDKGLFPTTQFTTTCMSDGWLPDPAQLVCMNESLNCSIPPNPPLNGYINEVSLSVVTFGCDEGYTPQGLTTAQCVQPPDTWRPEPAQMVCLSDEDQATSYMYDITSPMVHTARGLGSAATAGIVVTVLLTAVITVTIVITIIVLVMRKRAPIKSKPRSNNFNHHQMSSFEDDTGEYSTLNHPGPTRPTRNHTSEENTTCTSLTYDDVGTTSNVNRLPPLLYDDVGTASNPHSLTHADIGNGSNIRRPPPLPCADVGNSSSVQQPSSMVYADVGNSKQPNPVILDNFNTHRVEYSELSHMPAQNAQLISAQKPKLISAKDGQHPADKSLNLDSLLIQLTPHVTSEWEPLAEVLDLSEKMILDLEKYEERERMVEIFDHWLRNFPEKNNDREATWKDVADALKRLNYYQLAEDILKVYETGELPIQVDMDGIPLRPSEAPPPLPPKTIDFNDDVAMDPTPPSLKVPRTRKATPPDPQDEVYPDSDGGPPPPLPPMLLDSDMPDIPAIPPRPPKPPKPVPRKL